MTTQQDPPSRHAPPPPRVRDVVPHPALDVSLEESSPSRQGLDRWVFGVPAALAIGFVVWGFVSTASLASASSSALTWVMTSMGWLFVLTASGFVVFALWLAISRYGRIPLGRRARSRSSGRSPGSR